MTDEERRDAERLAQVWYFDDHGYNGFLDGYAAACEASRAEITHLKSKYGREVDRNCDLSEALRNERARSAKLIEALEKYKMEGCVRNQFGEVEWARKAIAEYKDSRD